MGPAYLVRDSRQLESPPLNSFRIFGAVKLTGAARAAGLETVHAPTLALNDGCRLSPTGFASGDRIFQIFCGCNERVMLKLVFAEPGSHAPFIPDAPIPGFLACEFGFSTLRSQLLADREPTLLWKTCLITRERRFQQRASLIPRAFVQRDGKGAQSR